MKFHVEFTYKSGDREKLLRYMTSEGLKSNGTVKFKGAWIAAETGRGFAIVETDDGAALYELCSQWIDYGELKVTPVIAASEI